MIQLKRCTSLPTLRNGDPHFPPSFWLSSLAGHLFPKLVVAPDDNNHSSMERATTEENHNLNPQSFSKIGQHRNLMQHIVPIVVFGALWSMLIAQLSQHWAVNPQYSFGWFVPVICAYLFLIGWRIRPPARLAHLGVARWVFWIAGFALLPT